MRIVETTNATPVALKSFVSPVIYKICGGALNFPVYPLGSNDNLIGTARLCLAETTRSTIDLLNFAINFRNISVDFYAFIVEAVVKTGGL